MADPVYLRPAISGSIYAEQVASAQIQGQAAARDRATRVRQEEIKDEKTSVHELEESTKVDIKEQDERRREPYQGLFDEDAEEGTRSTVDSRDGESPDLEDERGIRHIDVTI